MSVAYFDSSALVKLFVDEVGSDDASLLWDATDVVVTSRVAHPEIRSALAAAHRSRRIDAGQHEAAKAAWGQLRGALRLVELTEDVERLAGELAERHRLSGFDAVHLASASAVATLGVVVATWDARLLQAAAAEGFVTLPPGR